MSEEERRYTIIELADSSHAPGYREMSVYCPWDEEYRPEARVRIVRAPNPADSRAIVGVRNANHLFPLAEADMPIREFLEALGITPEMVAKVFP